MRSRPHAVDVVVGALSEGEYIYKPIYSSLLEGLKRVPAGRGGSTLQVRTSFRLESNVALALHRLESDGGSSGGAARARWPDVFIWVGVMGGGFPRVIGKAATFYARRARERGTTIVHYNAEPWCPTTAYNTSADSETAFAIQQSNFARVADEVWDYSHHNIDECSSLLQRRSNASAAAGRPAERGAHGGERLAQARGAATSEPPPPLPSRFRYVPPGPLQIARVRFRGGSREQSPQPPPELLFFGSKKVRARCWDAIAAASRAPIRTVYDVWDDAAFDALVSAPEAAAAVWLDISKDVCELLDDDLVDATDSLRAPALAAVRMSQLLSARALAVSTRRYWKDEREFDGLLDFVPFAQIGRRYEQLVQLGSHAREQMASRRFERFASRFDPAAVFERAGIYELLWSKARPDQPLDQPSE